MKSTVSSADFVAWLITQKNSHGKLYLERVAKMYSRYLKTAPPKLDIPLTEHERNVYACLTVESFDKLRKIFRAAPNYKKVNEYGHQTFSAGLNCYARYLEHLANFTNKDLLDKVKYMQTKTLSDDEETAILMVLEEKFSNGFQFDSPIQLGRLRKFTLDCFDIELSHTDETLIKSVKSFGTEFEGKIYIITEDTKNRIKGLADNYFAKGAKVIFYEAFFAAHENRLFETSVRTEEMLKGIFRKLYPNLIFTLTYFGLADITVNDVITNEILRIWGDVTFLTYSQISEQLRYIPYHRIKFALGQNGDFIINRRGSSESDGECIHISKIHITDIEKEEIRTSVNQTCLVHRYASLNDLDISEIEENNYGLSTAAIHTAIYQLCFNGSYGDYNRRGKILTRKGENIDALYIIKEYCLTQDRITLNELLALEVELTGEQHRWIPMQAGYDTMIRIDKQTFIADKYLDFDNDGIDIAIEYFLHGGEYSPLKAVINFAMFPHCGEAWNLFLLESYVRRFSKNFRFDTRSVNSKGVGAIVRQYSRLTYDDIMVDVVAQSGIILNAQNILNYLLENGLISQRRHKDIDGLISRTKTIRERGN